VRRYVLQAFVALAIATSWILVMPEARVAQPVAFNHAKHGAVACTTCHAGATAGARAGIPQGDVCLRCHATAPARGFPAAVWTDVEAGRRIAWRQITLVPDHVRFSHRRHTDAGHLACVSCHEDVQARTTPPDRAAVRLVMNTCLSCHKREGASEDCAGCHR
jgi:hypothetical protein